MMWGERGGASFPFFVQTTSFRPSLTPFPHFRSQHPLAWVQVDQFPADSLVVFAKQNYPTSLEGPDNGRPAASARSTVVGKRRPATRRRSRFSAHLGSSG